jgi:type 1 glutamine amidotransferase
MQVHRFLASLAIALTLGGLLTTTACAADRVISDEEIAKIREAAPEKAMAKPKKLRRLLCFYRTEGFYHGVIPLANEAFRIVGEKTGAYETTFSNDMSAFDNLDPYDGILFNNTTALKFEKPEHRDNLIKFVNSGRGIIGVHAATDNFYNWPEAAEMMGGLFWGHPWGGGGTWAIKIDDPNHPLAKPFDGKGFWIRDELYQFRDPYSREKLRVLLSIDMSKQTNQKVQGINRKDNDHAVAWIHEYQGGRVFYNSLGHNDEVFLQPAILKFYLNGIQWAFGDLDADATPSAELTSQPDPAPAPAQPK